MMPKKDGFMVANEIWRINNTIPILFLSAKSQTEDVIKGFEIGGNDYLKKPFSLEELIVELFHYQTEKMFLQKIMYIKSGTLNLM